MVEKIITRVLESLMGLIYQMNNQDSYLLPAISLHGICQVIYPPDEVNYDLKDY